MTVVYPWHIPDNAHVVMGGKIVSVPQFDISTHKAISQFADNSVPNLADFEQVRKWSMSRDEEELEIVRHYFLDRWTWDTGDARDKSVYTIMEQELLRRKELDASLSTHMLPLSKAIVEYIAMVGAMDESVTKAMGVPLRLISVNTSIAGDDTDDANSKPIQPDNKGHDSQKHGQ